MKVRVCFYLANVVLRKFYHQEDILKQVKTGVEKKGKVMLTVVDFTP